METKLTINYKKELKTIIALTLASCIIAFNLKSFVQTGGLFPGGFSGLTILIQRICEVFFSIHIPYSVLYLPLNLIPAFIGLKFISVRFTLYSFYVVALSGVLTDIFPSFTITYDTLLIAIFGGILNAVAISICLIFEASGGGTDFISIYFSEKKGIDAWNYIFAANVVILVTAGILFGFDKALYSIIYQYTSTQVIQMMFKRYQKDTLLIITELPGAVYGKIREITHHDATLIEATGCFEGAPRNILYSVVGREQVDKVIAAIKEIDPRAFINVINTEQINGRFYKKPY
ncbi:MAG: YitT family protein [Firmicutes bacterium]|nr:YitT family protein [Bacillota bacterium]